MAPAEGPPLSLRPFPIANKAPRNLADFIARVNTQPGGFRAVTEDKLRDEIKSRDIVIGGGESDPDDVDMSDTGGGNDDDPAKDPSVVRMEVLKNIEIASNTAMLTLDSLSLLLSKQNPTQAGLTLSQQLREMVGIGTLGANKLDEPTIKPNKARDDEEVALGWTLMQIDQARDAAEKAGVFLRKEVQAESKYWEDVVAVKTSGWAICRVPQARHTLGVRFGFSEAAAEFKNNGLAPMNRGDDGSIELDLGRLGGVSEGIVVTYEKDGEIAGRSIPRRRNHDSTSLESRVLEARNTIFSQELWHELTREARTLAAHDVRPEGPKLTYTIDDTSRITLELRPLESCPAVDDSLPQNSIAETISLSLHILLSYAHRYNELMRTRPFPPHISRTRGLQAYALLRPVIARMASVRSIQACAAFVGRLAQALRKAGLSSSFTLRTTPYSVVDPASQGPNQPAASQSLIRNALQPIEYRVNFTIIPDTSLTIRGRTFLFPVTTTFYHVLLPSSSVLQGLCSPYADGYTNIKGLFDYLRTATSRVLTLHFLNKLSASHTFTKWVRSVQNTSIRDAADDENEMQFSVQDSPVAVVVSSVAPGRDGRANKSWTWTAHGDSETQTMEAIVAEEASQSRS